MGWRGVGAGFLADVTAEDSASFFDGFFGLFGEAAFVFDCEVGEAFF